MTKTNITWQKIRSITYNTFVWFNVFFFAFLAYETIREAFLIPIPYQEWKHYKGQWNMDNPVNYFYFNYISGVFLCILVFLILKFRKKHPRSVWIGLSALCILYLLCFLTGVILQWLGWYIPC